MLVVSGAQPHVIDMLVRQNHVLGFSIVDRHRLVAQRRQSSCLTCSAKQDGQCVDCDYAGESEADDRENPRRHPG